MNKLAHPESAYSHGAALNQINECRAVLTPIVCALGMSHQAAKAATITELAQVIAAKAIRGAQEPEIDMAMAADILKIVAELMK